MVPEIASDCCGPIFESLAGVWTVCLDPEDVGRNENWFAKRLNGAVVHLPGSLPQQDIGVPVGLNTPWTGSIFDRSFFHAPEWAPYRQPERFGVPFFLQPRTYYAGAAWYQREVRIPDAWAGSDVRLLLERPHWATEVWLDDHCLGQNDSLSTPHVFAMPTVTGRHRLTIRVDNTRLLVDVGENSHSISDHTQGNWNGIVGRLELQSLSRERVVRLDPFPDAAARTVRLEGKVTESTPSGTHVRIRVFGPEEDVLAETRAVVGADTRFTAELSLGREAVLWDEVHPVLYRASAMLESGSCLSTRFGLRSIRREGRQILLNERPIFVRATLECAIFPRTGFPPSEESAWARIFRICRSYGLNTVRFHSWCPPEAAFAAADACGFFLQIEAASWPNWSTTLGDGRPGDAWIEAETGRIISTYGHHPSFLFMAMGNEPAGDHHEAWLERWVKRWRQQDRRRLYTTAAAWPVHPVSDFHVDTLPRLHQWGDNLDSVLNASPPEIVSDFREHIARFGQPMISHEIGQWCAFPDLSGLSRYTGHLRPRNYEIVRERMESKGLAGLSEAFVFASGRLQVLCYKAEIEAALRTPGMAGFHLLDLHDFPGQGTAPVGVLDAFWKEKGYVSADEFRRFCGPTVSLARLPKRVFTNSETLFAEIEIAHWAEAPAVASYPRWRLLDEEGAVVAGERLARRHLDIGGPFALGAAELPLHRLPAPARYRLEVVLDHPECANAWDIWVYPESEDKVLAAPGSVITASPGEALEALQRAERVLLVVGRERLVGDERGPVQLGFTPVFWNTSWTQGQAPHTLGILCDPDHPALADFPTECHSNWQWFYPIRHGGAMILDRLDVPLEPIVRVIDDWNTCRQLAMVIEAKVGRGRLLLCSIDLLHADDPVNRQLLRSLAAYIGSDSFRPQEELTEKDLRKLVQTGD